MEEKTTNSNEQESAKQYEIMKNLKEIYDQEFEKMVDHVMDVDGSRRAAASIAAGNDVILQFYPPKDIKAGVRATVQRVKADEL